MDRNYTLDFYKLIAAIWICFHHLIGEFCIPIIQSGHLFVELFFIISGMFLYKSFLANKNDDELTYTKKRLKKLYPHYLLSFIILYIFLLIRDFLSKTININNFIFSPLSEILMLNRVGIFDVAFNDPTWYLGVMIVGGYFIYYLLKNNHQKFIRFTGPLVVLTGYTLIKASNGNHVEIWSNVLVFCLPLVRGVADMTIGCLLGAFLENKDKIFTAKVPSYYIKLLEVITIVMLGILLTQRSNYELYSLLLFPILILLSYSKDSISNKILNKKIFQKIENLSYAIYLNHRLIIKILLLIAPTYQNTYLLILFYFLLLIPYSMLTMKTLGIIGKRVKRLK